MKNPYSHIIGLTFITFLIYTSTAFAQYALSTKDSKPAQFSSRPGETVNGTIVIKNVAQKPINLKIYPVDGTRTPEGNFAATTLDKKQVAIGEWTTLDKNELALKTDEKAEVNFTIKLPTIIPPGIYSGAIAVENAPAEQQQAAAAGPGVSVKTRMIMPIVVQIPGEKNYDIKINNFSHEDTNINHRFYVDIENKGNVAIATKVALTITNWDGTLEEIPERSFLLYQNEAAHFPIYWDKKPLWGLFKANAKLTYYEKDIFNGSESLINSEERELTFAVIPWMYLVIIIAVIVLLASLLTAKKLRMMFISNKSQDYIVKEGETLTGISEKNNVSWKLIAKINKIKAPYALSAGQKIKLPLKK